MAKKRSRPSTPQLMRVHDLRDWLSDPEFVRLGSERIDTLQQLGDWAAKARDWLAKFQLTTQYPLGSVLLLLCCPVLDKAWKVAALLAPSALSDPLKPAYPGLSLVETMQRLRELSKWCQDPEAGQWSRPDSVANWAKIYRVSKTTMSRWLNQGTIKARKRGRFWQVADSDLPKEYPQG
jgi:hypothetical protein